MGFSIEKIFQTQETNDNIITLSTSMLKIFFDSLNFSVSFMTENDDSITGIIEELDLIENAPSKDECLMLLILAMKNYAQDFYNEFNLWSSAPNRKKHIPYVLKILSSSDEELKESIQCQNSSKLLKNISIANYNNEK